MSCCPNKEYWQYVIEWCAWWVRVDQIVSWKFLRPWDRFFEYTYDHVNFITTRPVWRTPWACQLPQKEFDAQLTCIKENSKIHMIKWDESNNTFKIFDLSTNPPIDVTWTVTAIKCDDKEIESDILDRCVDWVDYSQHIVKVDWIPNWDVYWTNLFWLVSNPIPNWTTYNKWVCVTSKVIELWFESWCVTRTILNPIPPRVNRQCDSYASFTAQYDAWTNPKTYDNLYSIPWWPRNHYYRIKLFDWAWLMLSDTILWPYAVDTTNNTYLRFLSDLSAITAPVSVSFPWMWNIWTWYQIQYNDTVFFWITLEHWYDNHSWGIQWNAWIKQAISYQPWFSSVVDSINGGWDFNNVYSIWRDYATVNQPTNCITI